MRKSLLLLLAIPLLPCFSQAQDITGKWNGIMTLELWWDGITGPWHRKFDMTVQNNVVTGTMTGDGKVIMDGKTLAIGNCFGSGTGELWRVAFNPDGTYDLEAISHTFTCRSESTLDGSVTITNDNHEDIGAHSQPIPRNRKVLSGTIDTTAESQGIGTMRKYFSWTLIDGPLDAVLIVKPVNYTTWTPKPGRDELLKGDAMAVELKVQGLNGGASSLEAERFEIRLTGTSSEPGTTINYPVNPLYDLPDLRLLPIIDAENPGEGQSIEIECTNGSTGTFFIGSYDGGGWSDLKVLAILKGGIQIEGHLMNPAGVSTIPIPKRKPGSHIADAWLQTNGNPAEMNDKEVSPGNTNNGDGLSAYEEYRGVWRNNQHERLNPNKKELGVQSNRSDGTVFDEGIGWFKTASGLEVIRFTEDEIGTDRMLNKNNRTSNVYKQYVLKLRTGVTTKGAAGENRPTNLDYMLPYQSDEVVINTTYMNAFHPLQAAEARNMNVPMPYTLNELIASTVAHEIAHGVNVNHHGDHSKNVMQEREIWDGQGNFHVFNSKAVPQEIPVSQWDLDPVLQKHHFKIFGNTGERTPGNEESGDMSCFMCYTSMYNWSFVTGPDGSLNYYMVPLLPIGRKLCTKADATGINTKPWFFGPAFRGNCLGQIQLR
ncbi:MAG TPA: hypothetical protein VMZ03_07220 [Chitinophagaceae bacterium]|nr:hypothetical protein [Chitinophagaceae bacterium]